MNIRFCEYDPNYLNDLQNDIKTHQIYTLSQILLSPYESCNTSILFMESLFWIVSIWVVMSWLINATIFQDADIIIIIIVVDLIPATLEWQQETRLDAIHWR